MWRPLRRASVFLRQRAREWTVTGFLMINPSLTSFRICWPVVQIQCNKDDDAPAYKVHSIYMYFKRTPDSKGNNSREFALAISLVSLGSSHTFFLPQRKTLDAKRFWSLSMLDNQAKHFCWDTRNSVIQTVQRSLKSSLWIWTQKIVSSIISHLTFYWGPYSLAFIVV